MVSCTCEDAIDLRRVRDPQVHCPRSHIYKSRYTPDICHVHRRIDMIHDTSTTTRYKVGGVRTRSTYSIVLHQSTTNHVLVRKMLNPACGTTDVLCSMKRTFT